MAQYNVAFDVNGTVHTITCNSVKVGNMFLQCFAETAQNDDAKVAYIPFDAIQYIVHDSITVSMTRQSGEAEDDLVDLTE